MPVRLTLKSIPPGAGIRPDRNWFRYLDSDDELYEVPCDPVTGEPRRDPSTGGLMPLTDAEAAANPGAQLTPAFAAALCRPARAPLAARPEAVRAS